MIFLFIIETCFILSFPVQRTETDILHFLCSVFHARLIRNYVNHAMWKETRIATYILYFLLIKLKIFISTPQNAQKRFQTRGPGLEKEKKSKFFTMGILSMSWPNPAWDYESNINDDTQAKSLAAQVRTAFVRE